MSVLPTHPWHLAVDEFPIGRALESTVTAVTHYGVFVPLPEELDGCIFRADNGLSWHGVPDIGDEVQVEIIAIDAARRRIGLGLVGR
jgi:ribosomal protein S1